MRINALICVLLSFISRDNFEVFTFTPKAIQNILISNSYWKKVSFLDEKLN